MRISTAVAVGSPTVRVAAILVATLLIALMVAGAGIAGSRLLAADGPIVVDQSGNGTTTTITEALALAADGDTIIVQPGTYAESITIDKDITLSGEGEPGAVVIEFDAESPIVFADPSPFAAGDDPFPVGLSLETSAATVSGLTVSGPEPGMAVLVNGGSPTLERLSIVLARSDDGDGDDFFDARVSFQLMGGTTPVIRDSEWDGYLAVREGSAPTIEDNVITADIVSIDGPGETILRRNTFLDGASTSASEGATGFIEGNDFSGGRIGIDSGSDMVVANNTIRDASDGAAIYVADAGTSAIVEGNTVTGSGQGIVVNGGAEATVKGNKIQDGRTGIIVESGATSTIEDNVVTGNDIAIYVLRADPVIVANELDGNDSGVVVLLGSPTLEGNSITGGITGLNLSGLGTTPLLSDNIICDNETNLVFDEKAGMPDLTGNEICEDASAPSE